MVKLLLCLLLLIAGCRKEPAETKRLSASMHAFATSDTHLSTEPDVIDSIVPAMPYSADILRTIASQVIAADPDVFILTGDNTNSGSREDMLEVKKILMTVKEAGIPVVMTTGNHDFNRSTPQEYWDCYSELFDILEKDPDSLSYITEINNVRLFAMDDSSFDEGRTGTFSKRTMQWLAANLKDAAAEGKTVLFLSHHNVIKGPAGDTGNSYCITNSTLDNLLKQYGAVLCLSGHQHGQVIQQEDSLYEIISAMPLRSPHRIGEISLENNTLSYRTVGIDFETYGSLNLAVKIREADAREGEASMEAISTILKEEGLSGMENEGTMRLIRQFFEDYSAGILAKTAASIKDDPYCETMLGALWNHNYGPWMKTVLDDPPMYAEALSVSW